MNTVKKMIHLSESEAERISKHAHSLNKTFSQYVREIVLSQIDEDESLDLSEYLNKYCDYVSEKEQAEYEVMNLDKSGKDAVTISLEEVLSLAKDENE
ncbi:MAG: hypothetical protein Q4D65_05525 [Peptostreptococcaceae bacterium]|nr:hypothetical protein [Peptostreptococcaceae bacterium]